jgi:D-glycero-alpha-D-manno-heptose-7-phosphate kinase
LEEVSAIADIRHPIIREALRLVDVRVRKLEITSMADIPAGTGLGSSGSFTTALLKALHAMSQIARLANFVDIPDLTST